MLYPIGTESRLLYDLSGVWDFKLDNNKGFEEEWYAKPLENAETMPVPSSYNDIKEGIEHRGGFLPFEVEITDKVKKADNLLTIAVDNVIDFTTLPVGNPVGVWGTGADEKMEDGEEIKYVNKPNFDFFNYCGITRPVKIYTTPLNYVNDITLVPQVQGKKASIAYKIDTVGEGSCKLEVFDKKGELVAQAEGTEGVFEIENVHLWQPLHAYLYQVKVTFAEDVYVLPYGVRTVRVEGTKFLINEKTFYFKGYGKHEDTFPGGRGMNLPMNVKDISLMKWQGANSFRTSHYPYSEEMMRLCDEEGIVVIDETTAVGINLNFGGPTMINGEKIKTFDKEKGIQTAGHHNELIRDLVARDKNHACVVMWSIANEPDSGAEGAYDYFKPLFDLARELDPQKRPCTLVSIQMKDAPDTYCTKDLSDVICLNRYYGWYSGGPDLIGPMKDFTKELEGWGKHGKPVIITEYGADTVMGLHDTTPVMFTEEYQLDYYKMNNEVIDSFDFVIGEHVWNFADFATSQALHRVQGNKKGLFTRDRRPKLADHYFRTRWNDM